MSTRFAGLRYSCKLRYRSKRKGCCGRVPACRTNIRPRYPRWPHRRPELSRKPRLLCLKPSVPPQFRMPRRQDFQTTNVSRASSMPIGDRRRKPPLNNRWHRWRSRPCQPRSSPTWRPRALRSLHRLGVRVLPDSR